ncbi:MAG: hypothetical protein ACSW8C_02825 [bacterium]
MALANWKKRFLDMNTGVSKITIAEEIAQNFIQKKKEESPTSPLDDRLVRILNVKTLGSEVAEVLKPEMEPFEKLTPLGYQQMLQNLIARLQELKKAESRNAIRLLYQDAIRVLQAETVSAELLEEFRIMLLQG